MEIAVIMIIHVVFLSAIFLSLIANDIIETLIKINFYSYLQNEDIEEADKDPENPKEQDEPADEGEDDEEREVGDDEEAEDEPDNADNQGMCSSGISFCN